MEVLFSPDIPSVTQALKECLKARESLDMAFFLIGSRRLSRYIIRAHRKGIRVRVVTDGKVSKSRNSVNWYLQRHGVDVRAVKVSRGSMHSKFILIDGKKVILGSANITNDADRRNHEFLILSDDSELVSKFRDKFEELWAVSQKQTYKKKKEHHKKKEKHKIQLLT